MRSRPCAVATVAGNPPRARAQYRTPSTVKNNSTYTAMTGATARAAGPGFRRPVIQAKVRTKMGVK